MTKWTVSSGAGKKWRLHGPDQVEATFYDGAVARQCAAAMNLTTQKQRIDALAADAGYVKRFVWDTPPHSRVDNYQVADVEGVGRFAIKRAGKKFISSLTSPSGYKLPLGNADSMEEAKKKCEAHK